MSDLARQIKEKALSLGYVGCGIINVEDVFEYASKLKERMSRVRFGWLQFQQFRKFANPQKEHEWAKAIIITLNDNTVYTGQSKVLRMKKGIPKQSYHAKKAN